MLHIMAVVAMIIGCSGAVVKKPEGKRYRKRIYVIALFEKDMVYGVPLKKIKNVYGIYPVCHPLHPWLVDSDKIDKILASWQNYLFATLLKMNHEFTVNLKFYLFYLLNLKFCLLNF